MKSQSKSRKLFLVWTVWVGYLARENQNRKNEKSNTRASENRLYRSRIAGNFDTAKSQGATTARTRADGSSLLGHHGHQGDLEKTKRTKTHQSKNRKLKEKREIGNPPKKIGNRKPTKKSDSRKFRSSARKRRLGIAGTGVIRRRALTFLGPFEVSYIPPCPRNRNRKPKNETQKSAAARSLPLANSGY